MASEARYLSRSEFAKLRGCAASYVTKLGHQGRLVMDDSGKLVDVAATIALLDRTDDPARGGDRTGKAVASPGASAPLAGASAAPAPDDAVIPPAAGQASAAPTTDGVYKVAATRERIAKARLAELELAEKAGNLVRRDEVEAAIFGMARQAMEVLDAIADRLSTQLAAESDPARVHALISADIRQVKQQIAEARPLPDLPEQPKEAA